MSIEATREEPAPVKTDEPHIWDLVVADVEHKRTVTVGPPDHPSRLADLVIADMRARDQMGFERYGAHLQASNGRDPLIDAYQEALDYAVYMRQAVERGSAVHGLYDRAIATIFAHKAALLSR